MTYTTPSYYVTFGGGLFGTGGNGDVWSSGLHFVNPGSTDVSAYLDRLDDISVSDILQDVSELIQNVLAPSVRWTTAVSVEWAKVAVLKTDGAYAGPPQLAEQAPKRGTVAFTNQAPQLAVCVSMWSGQTFGRANHGRSYLPEPYSFHESTTNTDPRASSEQAEALRVGFALMLDHITGEVSTLGFPVKLAIMSKIGTGTTKYVSHLGVGRAIDTMRSRRSNLDEQTVYVAYTGP